MTANAALPVIVLRSNDICFLGILRSCRAAGIHAIPVTFTWPEAPVWYSDYSACLNDGFEISNPFTHAEKAAAELEAILRSLYQKYGARLAILPSSDTNMMFLMDHYEKFERYIFLMGHREFSEARHDVVNKAACAELLEGECPDLVPVTLRCQSERDIDAIVERIVYPAVYKPTVKDYGQTFYRVHGGNKAIECANADELRRRLIDEMAQGFDLIVQEKLIFDSVYDEIPFYLYADGAGNITMAGNGIKELIEPFPFGTAIILRFAWLPELLDLARRVVSALRYRGILMIEFVRDQKDGRWKVVEVNPRHWLFNGFYQRIGLNYTQQFYLDSRRELPSSTRTTVSDTELARQHAHIDLIAVGETWRRADPKLTLDQYLANLEAIGGCLSAAFYDPADTEPGIQRLESMFKEMRWPIKGVNDVLLRLDA